jgi:hypothetical protein
VLPAPWKAQGSGIGSGFRVRISIPTYIYIYKYTYIYKYIHIHVYMYMYMYIYMYAFRLQGSGFRRRPPGGWAARGGEARPARAATAHLPGGVNEFLTEFVIQRFQRGV